MNRLSIVMHHSESELLRFEKSGRNERVKERIRAIRLLGFSSLRKKEIVKILGRSRTTLLGWSHRYNSKGVEGLQDQVNRGGRKPICSLICQKKIESVLSKPPPDGGLWNGPKLRLWMEQELDVKLGKAQGWKTLRRLGYTIQVPKPANTKANKKLQASFKKSASRSSRRAEA